MAPEICNKGEFTLSLNPLFINNKVKAVIPKDSNSERIEYILGLLNSKLMVFLYSNIAPRKGHNYFEIKTAQLLKLPYRQINFNNPEDTYIHDKIVMLVEKILGLKGKILSLQTSSKKSQIEREIQITDDKIDELVYELYGITEEEIKIIEEGI